MKKISRRAFFKAALNVAALGAAGAALCSLSGCGAASSGVTASGAASSGVAASGAASSGAAVPGLTAPQLTPEAYPRVDGSTACIPLMASLYHECTGTDLLEAQTGITVSTTAYAWQNIGAWDEAYADLLIVYEAPDYVQQMISDAGTALEVTPIGRDALVFIANEANPVSSLSRQQLIDIYGGKITDWKALGGEDIAIVAFQRSEDSGSQALFKKLLMQDNPLMAAPTELCPAEMGSLVDGVAAYNNSANALGYSVYYYIDQMYSQPGLKLLAVDGVAPSRETIREESYPLCNQFYAVIRADEVADSPARKLYDWLTSAEGAGCIEAAGYVAVNV